MDILERIMECYPDLNKTKKRIASYIMENPTRCCFLTLKEFARETSSSEVTVLNFCRFLGLDRYIELKKALQSHMLFWTRPVDRMKEVAKHSRNREELFNKIVKSEMKTLKTAFQHNGPEQILGFIDMIKQAKRIFVAAHGFSRIFAQGLAYRFTLLGVDISTLDMDDYHSIILKLLGCNPKESLLISISTPPYGHNTLATTRMCLSRKMPAAAITDSSLSPLASMVETSLICPTELMGMTNSPTSIVAIMDVLAMFYMADQKEKEDGIQESAAEEYDYYLRLFTNGS